jgi:hypothetical protein
MNTPFYISGREKTNPPDRVSSTRYQYLSLKDAEPNLGIPLSNALPASATWVLTTDALGNRYFSTTLLYDSTYSTLKETSANFVSVFTTVQSSSSNWQSTYTTLNTNSGTWLTVTSANSLYFKTSGGLIEGDLKIQGNMLIIGALSALSGLEFITTKATTTSSLSIVNVGFGPALYVSQDGFYDIAKFYDAEGGIAMLIGNITPPGTYSGVVGIKTEYPNKTLTVIGDISSTQGFYTEGPLVSAGVTLDTIIFNAVPPTLQSVYSTVSANSGSWTNVYTAWSDTSSQYVSYNTLSTQQIFLCAADIFGNVNIFGNLVTTGSAFFTNTIVSVTSALSVVNSGPGPALFVSQGKGQGDIASFYDADYGNEVFHVGNAVDFNGVIKDGVVGIKTGSPNKTLTVVGEISSTGKINDLKVLYNAGNVILGENINQNIQGINNVIVGDSTGTVIDFGQSNVFVGHNAGANVVDGSYNVLIGDTAGYNTTQGTSNIFIGNNNASNNQTGNYNISLGTSTLINQTLGGYNIAFGTAAGGGIVSGNYNIIIGAQNYSNNTSRSLVIGNNARATKDFQAVIGDPIFPFVDGIYYGNMSYYGSLTANDTTAKFLSALNDSFLNRATIRSALNVLGNISINSNLSSFDGTVKIIGNQTITGALSVTTLSATNIVGFYSILPYQNFTGDGTNTDFTLLSAVRSVNDINVFVGGVYQSKDYYTLITPNLLRMSTPPPNGTLLEVSYQKPSQIPFSTLPLPGPGTIQYSMLANRIIDSDKLTFDAVSSLNIADFNIPPVKLTRGAPGWSAAGTLTAANIISPGLISSIQSAVSSLSAQDLLKGTFIHSTSTFLLPAFGITRRGRREIGSMRYNTDTGIYEAYHDQFPTPLTPGLAVPGWYGLGRTLISSNRFTASWNSISIIWMTPGNIERHNYSAFDIETFIPRASNTALQNKLRLAFRFIPYITFTSDSSNSYWVGGRWYSNNTGSAETYNNGSNSTGISYGMYSNYHPGDNSYWWSGGGNTGYYSCMRMRTNPGTATNGSWQGSLYIAHQNSYNYGSHTDFHVQYTPQIPIYLNYLGRTIWPIAGFNIFTQEGNIPSDSFCNTIVNVYGINGWEGNQVYE